MFLFLEQGKDEKKKINNQWVLTIKLERCHWFSPRYLQAPRWSKINYHPSSIQIQPSNEQNAQILVLLRNKGTLQSLQVPKYSKIFEILSPHLVKFSESDWSGTMAKIPQQINANANQKSQMNSIRSSISHAFIISIKTPIEKTKRKLRGIDEQIQTNRYE